MHGNTTISLQRTGSERKNSVGWDPTEFHRFSFWKEIAGRLFLEPRRRCAAPEAVAEPS